MGFTGAENQNGKVYTFPLNLDVFYYSFSIGHIPVRYFAVQQHLSKGTQVSLYALSSYYFLLLLCCFTLVFIIYCCYSLCICFLLFFIVVIVPVTRAFAVPTIEKRYISIT